MMMNEEDIFEMCECGHVGGSSPKIYNMHNDQLVNGKVVARGHGDCKCSDKDHVCDKFLWVKFCDKEGNEIDDNIMKGVIQKELADLHIQVTILSVITNLMNQQDLILIMQ